MGKEQRYVINDKEMYEYFEALLYPKENSRLKVEWKTKDKEQGYGLTENNVAMLLGSKSLLYGREDARKQLCLLDTLEKFLHEYIGVEGLEELFINNYGVIENNIFLEHDAGGNSQNIREHAKHQMKNAYLGSVLLLECEYLPNVAQNIYQAQSPITLYLRREAEKMVGSGTEMPKESEVQKKLEELAYKIFMVSSLLHDIGYPLAYYLRAAKQMTDYPPYLKILCPTVKTEFAELKSYLLDSKLFRLIDQQEISGKYSKDDHGVLSALSLLMHFYHNGRIYALKPEERCIVEMAAIAIYRHTDKFAEGTRMVYLADPISYMVRLCDDMQEWERFKISINEKHNYLQCGSCGRRITEDKGNYQCACGGQKYKKITMISNRKLNYVCLCDELIVEKNLQEVKITPAFHLMKQMEILLDDYTAVAKSKMDMDAVCNMVAQQSLYPKLKVDYFVSNNPIMLIERMIEKSGNSEMQIEEALHRKARTKKKQDAIDEFWLDFQAMKKDNPFGKKIEKNQLKYGNQVKEYVEKYLGQIYSLYELVDEILEDKKK